ncbi:MAG: 5-oxoprolinase subunit PxpA [Lysobacterales bacterium]
MAEYCDLNADLGESFGAWTMGDDAALLEVVSSCNIACGFHAGDPLTMQHTVATALASGVAVGAHPSLPDLVGFGRREMRVDAADLYALALYQISALDGFVRAAGGRLHHVKAHGALYGMLAREPALARAFVDAVVAAGPDLQIYGPDQGALRRVCEDSSPHYVCEGFADRGYLANGQLVPRSQPGALLELDAARAQGLALASAQPIAAVDGTRILPEVQTLCVHGDGPHALALASQLRADLLAAGLGIRAP